MRLVTELNVHSSCFKHHHPSFLYQCLNIYLISLCFAFIHKHCFQYMYITLLLMCTCNVCLLKTGHHFLDERSMFGLPLTFIIISSHIAFSTFFSPPCGVQMTDSQRAADICQRYCQDMGISYFRINVPLDKKVNTIIRDVEVVVEILVKARQHLQDSPQLRELALRLDDLATSAKKVHDML